MYKVMRGCTNEDLATLIPEESSRVLEEVELFEMISEELDPLAKMYQHRVKCKFKQQLVY
jgi:hypothetical protein